MTKEARLNSQRAVCRLKIIVWVDSWYIYSMIDFGFAFFCVFSDRDVVCVVPLWYKSQSEFKYIQGFFSWLSAFCLSQRCCWDFFFMWWCVHCLCSYQHGVSANWDYRDVTPPSKTLKKIFLQRFCGNTVREMSIEHVQPKTAQLDIFHVSTWCFIPLAFVDRNSFICCGCLCEMCLLQCQTKSKSCLYHITPHGKV